VPLHPTRQSDLGFETVPGPIRVRSVNPIARRARSGNGRVSTDLAAESAPSATTIGKRGKILVRPCAALAPRQMLEAAGEEAAVQEEESLSDIATRLVRKLMLMAAQMDTAAQEVAGTRAAVLQAPPGSPGLGGSVDPRTF